MLRHATLGDVLPGRGLGAIRLGMSIDEARWAAGAQSGERREADGRTCLDCGGVELLFAPEHGGRLTAIELSDMGALPMVGRPAGTSPVEAALTWLGEAGRTQRLKKYTAGPGGSLTVAYAHHFPTRGITVFSDASGALTGVTIFVVLDGEHGPRWPPA